MTMIRSHMPSSSGISEETITIDTPAAAQKAGIPLVRDLHYKTGATFNGTWFKLVRIGNTYTGYASEDGNTRITVGSKTIDMADEIYVGFAVDGNKAANKINNLSTAKFSNIQINKEFTYVNYELTHITTKGEGYAASGQDITAKLVSDDG